MQTSDPDHLGDYLISVTGSVPLAFMDPTYEEELLVRLSVIDVCADDEVSGPTAAIEDDLYLINFDGEKSIAQAWYSTTVPGCAIEHDVLRVIDGVARPLTTDEQLVISQLPADGSLRYSTSNFALDGEVWTIRVVARSVHSTSALREATSSFQIEFRDRCWDLALMPAQFQ